MIPIDDEWRVHANCINREDLFNLEFPPEVEGVGLDMDPGYAAWVTEHREKFARAEEICLDCPVFIQCGKAASEEDKQWTMRSGEAPALFPLMARYPLHMCKNKQHQIRVAEGALWCVNCKSSADYRERTKEKRAAQKKAWAEANKERLADLRRKWIEDNREANNEKRRIWREANKDRRNAKRRADRAAGKL